VLGTRNAQDERHAVAGQERARRPHEDVVAEERDPDLEHGTRAERDEDLRDREVEAERSLSEDLQRDDDRRQVEARVAGRRQEDRVLRSPDRQRRPTGEGRRAHGSEIVLRTSARARCAMC
jgi:hypothetical protein